MDIIDEERLKNAISSFKCEVNPDVDAFLKNNAIDFTKKPISVGMEGFSKVMLRKIARVSENNKERDTFYLSAYLIAQLGKNFASEDNMCITGEQLINIAMKQVKKLQFMAGGTVVFLETEDNEKLLNYYKDKNGFKTFKVRETRTKDGRSKKLLQMLKVIN